MGTRFRNAMCIIVMWLGLSVMMLTTMYGRMHVRLMRSDGQLYHTLDNHCFVLVLFYQKNSCLKCDQVYMNQLATLFQTFKAVSRSPKYKEKDIACVKRNIECDFKGILSMRPLCQTPAFVLFKNGDVIQKNKMPSIVYGFLSQNDLQQFVDSYMYE